VESDLYSEKRSKRKTIMKKVIFAIAATAFATGASAQDAFITQLGDNLNAVNYSEYNQGVVSTQVIAQQGTGFSAANLSRGRGNVASTYQIDTAFDNSTQGVDRDSSTGTMESLIVQTPSSFLGGQNTAVTVQLNDGGSGSQNFAYRAQTIQQGNGNVGVNWAQQRAGGLAGFTYGGIVTPTVDLAVGTTNPTTPDVSTGFTYGSSITVN
jgi:hypothetical protein